MLGFSYRRDRILLWSVLAVIGWYFLGSWLTSMSDKHEWLSSFVEIAFALDSSLTIERARLFLLKPFSNCCYRRMEKMRVACGRDLDDKTTETLTKKAQDLYSRFSSRMASDMQWMPYFGGGRGFCIFDAFAHGLSGGKREACPSLHRASHLLWCWRRV